MKTTLKTLALVAAVSVAAITGCKKYEEGPSFSLASKKSRLAGEWSVSKMIVDGTDVTALFLPSGSTYKVTIEKDGTWTSVATMGSVSENEKGTWEFVDKKESIVMVTEGSGDADGDTSLITMLKSKELHLKQTGGGNTTEIHLIQ